MSTFRNLLSKTSSVPGFVGGWKSYGRSNSEDASTRDILPDYSGNGRDIKLYNFAFAGMSGFGGYQTDMSKLVPHNDIAVTEITYMSLKCTRILKQSNSPISEWGPNQIASGPATVRFRITGVSNNLSIRFESYTIEDGLKTLFTSTGDGVYTAEISNPAKYYRWIAVTQDTTIYPVNCNVTIEQLPTYPGGLVSDGVDDYGQCIKGFSLPDDYTVVALRKYIGEWKNANGAFLARKRDTNKEAFAFEGQSQTINCSSYGKGVYFPTSKLPALFSYQNKTSYNGNALTPGVLIDDSSVPLIIFGSVNYAQAVLYDLRIYDHSLTDEELAAVKDEMMSDYEKNTKPLDGITYIADWDAKGRSNDEDADVRNKWVDKVTGKVINLNNFTYAGMSGWNGYAEDFLDWESRDTRIKITNNSFTVPVSFGSHPVLFKRGGHSASVMRIKVSGLTKGKIIYLYNDSELSFTIEQNGVYDLPESVSAPESTVKFASRFQFIDNSTNVTVEQLPLYPGALVGDGVDDYGVTQEAINEEVGTMLVYARLIDESAGGYYILNTNNSPEDNGRLYLWRSGNGKYAWGLPNKSGDNPPFILTREPLAPNLVMYIASSSPGYCSACFVHRIIIIREQLNETQVEFLRWKVEKEYREWCRANGYEYAINQLTE